MPLPPIGAAPAAPLAPPSTASPSTGRSFGAVLEARAARIASGSTPGPEARLPATAAEGLVRIERAQRRLDGLLAAARSGRTFTAQELMALQGEAYRYSQTVDLAAKLVEQGAQAVKQALHSQV